MFEHIVDQHFWIKKGKKELEDALNLNWNEGIAKNIIIFVGDGMGPNTITAARIYKSGEGSSLSFETFPHIGLLKVSNKDKIFYIIVFSHNRKCYIIH